jgi:hypothetical protein
MNWRDTFFVIPAQDLLVPTVYRHWGRRVDGWLAVGQYLHGPEFDAIELPQPAWWVPVALAVVAATRGGRRVWLWAGWLTGWRAWLFDATGTGCDITWLLALFGLAWLALGWAWVAVVLCGLADLWRWPLTAFLVVATLLLLWWLLLVLCAAAGELVGGKR